MDHFATLGARDDGPIFETWTLLAAMAQLTTRLRIGCAVVGNTYRHPGVLAKMAVTVDHLSGGRLDFGIGAGWAENEHTMLGLEFGTRQGPRRPARGERPGHPGAVDPAADHVCGPALPVAGCHRRAQAGSTASSADLDRRLGAQPDAADRRPICGRVERGRWHPEDVAASSTILDRHCADVGRDPSEIRRSVQVRISADTVHQVPADGPVLRQRRRHRLPAHRVRR